METTGPEGQSAEKPPRNRWRRPAAQKRTDSDERLIEAARAGDLSAAKVAIASGAREHITGDSLLYSNTVVNLAAGSGNAKLVEYLLKVGARRQAFDTEGIGTALISGNVPMVRAFLKYWRFDIQEYLRLLDCATCEEQEEAGKLLLRFCPPGCEVDGFRSFIAERRRERREEGAKKEAEAQMQAAPPSTPRRWSVARDGIHIEGPWDAALGSHLRELGARWLSPGWRVSLRRAAAVAQLLRDYPRLEAERQEMFQPARECLAGVPMPTGYAVYYGDWHLDVRGRGNVALDALLTGSFGDGFGMKNGDRAWDVPCKRAPELVQAFQRHAPPPKPPPVTEAEAAEALQGARTPAGYTCQVCSNGIVVAGPYLDGLAEVLRALGGTWNPGAKRWTIPLRKVAELREALSRFAPDPARIPEASAALAGVTAPEGYTCQVRQDGIYVSAPEADGLARDLKRLGARWDEASRRWYLPLEKADALCDLFRRLPDQAAEARRIMAAASVPEGYTCQVSCACIFVGGPKNDSLRKRFLKLEGWWHPEVMKWSFPLGKAPALAELLAGCS